MSAPDARRRLVAGVLLVLLAVAALRDLARLDGALPWRTMVDFPDFYCAGRALDRGANPYTYEPLHSCERRVNVGNAFRAALFADNATLAVPAPLPPYDLLPFKEIARMPVGEARLLDAIAIAASVLVCAAFLAALGVSFWLAAAALAFPAGYIELNTGQIVPFALLLLVLCGWALARRHDPLAGVLAVCTWVEPIAGLPVTLAVLFFVPRARWAAGVTAAAVALLALSVGGEDLLRQYVTRVVPAQAASELHFPFQYSLSYALAHFGMASGAARSIGEISYLLLLFAGLMLASRAARRQRRRELLVFVPALCCVLGGAYLHAEELALAVPALLVFSVQARGTARIACAAALCGLAVPWILVWGEKQLFLASLFVCAVILLQMELRTRAAVTLFVLIAAAIYALELHPPHLPVPTTSAKRYSPNALVEDEWREYAERRGTTDPLWFAIKIPAWSALLAGVALAARAGART